MDNNSSLRDINKFVHLMRPIKGLMRYSNNPHVKNKDTVASHTWRSTLLALLLASELQESNPDIDWSKVIAMLIIHDIIEIGQNEVKALGFRNRETKAKREQEISQQIFSGFTSNGTMHIKKLLEEFLDQTTIEAKLAKAIENFESNMHVIEEVEPILDKDHCQRTIDYISRRFNILNELDELIKIQLEEINEIKNSNRNNVVSI